MGVIVVGREDPDYFPGWGPNPEITIEPERQPHTWDCKCDVCMADETKTWQPPSEYAEGPSPGWRELRERMGVPPQRWAIYICPDHPEFPIGCTVDEDPPTCGDHIGYTAPEMKRIDVAPDAEVAKLERALSNLANTVSKLINGPMNETHREMIRQELQHAQDALSQDS